MYKCCNVNRIYYSTALGETTTPTAATFVGLPCSVEHDRVFLLSIRQSPTALTQTNPVYISTPNNLSGALVDDLQNPVLTSSLKQNSVYLIARLCNAPIGARYQLINFIQPTTTVTTAVSVEDTAPLA